MAHRVPLSIETLEIARKELKNCAKALDLIPRHIVITDPNANILYATPETVKVTGFAMDEIIGKNPGDIYGGQMEDAFYKDMWKRIKEEKKRFIGPIHNVKKNGKEYFLELYILPVLDKSNNVKYFLGLEPDFVREESLTSEQLDKLEKILTLFEKEDIRVEDLISFS